MGPEKPAVERPPTPDRHYPGTRMEALSLCPHLLDPGKEGKQGEKEKRERDKQLGGLGNHADVEQV